MAAADACRPHHPLSWRYAICPPTQTTPAPGPARPLTCRPNGSRRRRV